MVDAPDGPAGRSPPLRARPLRVVGLLLLAGLGFALAASVHTRQAASQLATARPEDLVRVLDDLDNRSSRLRTQIADLERTRAELSGTSSDAAALAEARKRVQDLGILTGAIPAEGPGIVLTVTDPQHTVATEVFVDAIEELRDAGAETIEISGVRLGATSSVADTSDGLSIDGHAVRPPYTVLAIGDPPTMAKALQIPGGVVDTVEARAGASARIREEKRVKIQSLRAVPGGG